MVRTCLRRHVIKTRVCNDPPSHAKWFPARSWQAPIPESKGPVIYKNVLYKMTVHGTISHTPRGSTDVSPRDATSDGLKNRGAVPASQVKLWKRSSTTLLNNARATPRHSEGKTRLSPLPNNAGGLDRHPQLGRADALNWATDSQSVANRTTEMD